MSQKRQGSHNRWQNGFVVKRHDRQIVNFQVVGHQANPGSIVVAKKERLC